MNSILALQELPAADGTELEMPLVSTLSFTSPCPGLPSAFTYCRC